MNIRRYPVYGHTTYIYVYTPYLHIAGRVISRTRGTGKFCEIEQEERAQSRSHAKKQTNRKNMRRSKRGSKGHGCVREGKIYRKT